MRGVDEFDSPEKTHDNGGLISLPLASPVGTMVEGSSGSGSVAFRHLSPNRLEIDLFGKTQLHQLPIPSNLFGENRGVSVKKQAKGLRMESHLNHRQLATYLR